MAAVPPDVQRSTHFDPDASAKLAIQTAQSPFTLEIWVRVQQLNGSNLGTVIFGAADNSFIIGLQNSDQGASFVLAAAGSTITGPAVAFEEWTYLALSYDGASTLTFYGETSAPQTLSCQLAPAPAIVIGQQTPNTSFEVSDVAFWNVARTEDQIAVDAWATPTTSQAGLTFYGDFSENPPSELFGSQIATTNTSYVVETPNVRNVASGYVLPAPASDLNPNFSAPFTLSVWTRALPTSPPGGIIYANGDASAPGSWSIIFMNPGLEIVVPGPGANISLGQFPLNNWTHIAVTWDMTTCTVYINGTAALATGAAPATGVAAGQSMLFAQMSNGSPSSPYLGHIQTLSCWKACLTPQQVQASMYADASQDPACTAFFVCSINPPADLSGLGGNGVTGQDLLQLKGSGVAFDQAGTDSGVGAPELAASTGAALPALGMGPGRTRPAQWEPVAESLERRFECHGGSGPTFEHFSDAHLALMRREMQTALVTQPDPLLCRQMSDAFEAELNSVFERARTDPSSIPQTFTYERRGDRWVILRHEPDGPRVIREYDATITPECVIWWATFMYTIINGILSLYLIAVPESEMNQIIDNYVFDAKFTAALVVVLQPGMSLATLFGAIGVMYNFGLLGKAFWAAFSSLSWWAAGKALVWMIGYVAPTMTPQKALLIANSVLLIANLSKQLGGYSAACGNQAHEGLQLTA